MAVFSTIDISDIELDSATSGGGNIPGGTIVVAKGICWNTTGFPTLETYDGYTNDFPGSPDATNFESLLTGLFSGTHYYVSAYYTDEFATVYGGVKEFDTLSLPAPIPILNSTGTPNSNSTTCSVTITADGPTTACGVCWNTTGSPTIEICDGFTNEGVKENSISFDTIITGLIPVTFYYVRSYATNANGTNYDEYDQTFTTDYAYPPGVNFDSVDTITSDSAVGYGSLSGGDNATAHGFCWNTIGNPTTLDSFVDYGALNTNQSFQGSIPGLTPNTHYYIRAYATNDGGSSDNGYDIQFDTLPLASSPKFVNILGKTLFFGGKRIISNP